MEILWRILATLVIWLTSWRQCMVFVNGWVNAEATNDKKELYSPLQLALLLIRSRKL